MHNELSYAGWSPRLCLLPMPGTALEGGETSVADGREIYQALPARESMVTVNSIQFTQQLNQLSPYSPQPVLYYCRNTFRCQIDFKYGRIRKQGFDSFCGIELLHRAHRALRG